MTTAALLASLRNAAEAESRARFAAALAKATQTPRAVPSGAGETARPGMPGG